MLILEVTPVWLLLYITPATQAANLTEVETLHQQMFSGYNRKLLPMINQDDTVNVTFDMSLVSINEFNEMSGELVLTLIFFLRWKEERMTWNPKNHGNKSSILVPSEDIWTPEIFLVNAADEIENIGNISMLARIYHDGSVLWMPGNVVRLVCSVDVRYYPFDEQNCSLTFTTWAYEPNEIKLQSSAGNISDGYFSPNSQWSLKSSTSFELIYDSRSFISFTLTLKRRSEFFIIYIIIPILFLGVLNNMVFLMPAKSGERTSVAVTTFLAFAVYMSIINDNVPQSSLPISYLYYYLLFLMLNSSFIMFLCVISLRIYDKDGPVFRPLQDIVRILRCSCCCPRRQKVTPKPLLVHNSAEDQNVIPLTPTADGNTLNTISTKYGGQGNQLLEERSADTKPEEVTWDTVAKTFDAYCFILIFLTHGLTSSFVLFTLQTNTFIA